MSWHLYVLSFIFGFSGIFHLIYPKVFMRIMPLYIPYHRLLVYLSGIAEIFVSFGLLFTLTKTFSAWSIIFMLILFFPVHIHMLTHKKASLNFPKLILVTRLLLQFGLIYWVHLYL
ncbi:putative membrane protein [Aquimarina sp. MAR_2010_214]|nr:putative membrane protein [Aquimarina sp. MAR_2010_214]